MRTIVAGSRNCNSIETVKKAIENCGWEISVLISGCAKGVDSLGEEVAFEKKIPVERFPANWNLHGKSAGIIRNIEMAKIADALIAVWDGKSRGTKHMIDEANKRNLKVYVENI